jgi:hypothetical protein
MCLYHMGHCGLSVWNIVYMVVSICNPSIFEPKAQWKQLQCLCHQTKKPHQGYTKAKYKAFFFINKIICILHWICLEIKTLTCLFFFFFCSHETNKNLLFKIFQKNIKNLIYEISDLFIYLFEIILFSMIQIWIFFIENICLNWHMIFFKCSIQHGFNSIF